jgi:hypothetical protein
MPPLELATRPPLAMTRARASNFMAPATPWSAGPEPRITSVPESSTTTSAFCGDAKVRLTLMRLPAGSLSRWTTMTWSTAEANTVRRKRAPMSNCVCAVAVGRCSSRRYPEVFSMPGKVSSRSPTVWYDICRSGRAITCASMSFCASAYWPANTSSRTLGRAARASGLTGSYGPPEKKLSSLSCRRSLAMPPKTMAPSRPLPTGRAWTHSSAGRGYQSESPRGPGSAASRDSGRQLAAPANAPPMSSRRRSISKSFITPP